MQYRALTHVGTYVPGDLIDAASFQDAERLDLLVKNGHLEPVDGEAPKTSDGPDLSLYDHFLPNSKSEIQALSIDKLKALATIKGVQVEGNKKADYVNALFPADAPTEAQAPVQPEEPVKEEEAK